MYKRATQQALNRNPKADYQKPLFFLLEFQLLLSFLLFISKFKTGLILWPHKTGTKPLLLFFFIFGGSVFNIVCSSACSRRRFT